MRQICISLVAATHPPQLPPGALDGGQVQHRFDLPLTFHRVHCSEQGIYILAVSRSCAALVDVIVLTFLQEIDRS